MPRCIAACLQHSHQRTPGIIIDAFSENRQASKAIEADKKNIDFVSGLPREKFDEVGVPGGFDAYDLQALL
eukprot:COSAG01_NODE_177_length_22954_cov_28.699554_12_plen_71_part_00